MCMCVMLDGIRLAVGRDLIINVCMSEYNWIAMKKDAD